MQSTITSRDNPKIKEYVRLRDSKSARAAEKKFVLEGLRIVEDALRENAPLSAAFMTEDAAEKHGGNNNTKRYFKVILHKIRKFFL